jgi:hypothetical protein
MMNLISMLTGGRPMKAIDDNLFTDVVSGRRVGLFIDRFGRKWLAEHRWAIFRVGVNPTVDD